MPCSTAERVPGAVIQACLPALPQRHQHALARRVLGTVLAGSANCDQHQVVRQIFLQRCIADTAHPVSDLLLPGCVMTPPTGLILPARQSPAAVVQYIPAETYDMTSGAKEECAMVTVQDLVKAKLYADDNAVIVDALRHLLRNRPDLRINLAIYRYQHEAISLAQAADLAGVSWPQMRDILRERGIPLQLGPETIEEARAEVDALYEELRPRS